MKNDAVAGGELAENWEEHARTDPLWAILSADDKRGGGWDIDDFFNTGLAAIVGIMQRLARYEGDPPLGTAVDFGCGVGRLTQGLAEYYDRVIGVDVSPTMVALARELNFNPERVEFLLNESNHLEALDTDSVDLVHSQITLQHIATAATLRYLREFLRILRPGGLLVFNLPAAGPHEASATPKPMPENAYRAAIRIIEAPQTMEPATAARMRVAVRNDSPIAWDRSELSSGAVEGWWSADGTQRLSEVGAIDVGNRWLYDGLLLVKDDGRVELPGRLEPGEEAEVELSIFSPPQAGTYECQVDLVHEWVAWFADHGSPTASCSIEVKPPGLVQRWMSRLSGFAGANPGWSGLAAAVLQRRRERLQGRNRNLEAKWEAIVDRLPAAEGTPPPFEMFTIPEPEVVSLLESSGGEILGIEKDHSAGWAYDCRAYFVRKTYG